MTEKELNNIMKNEEVENLVKIEENKTEEVEKQDSVIEFLKAIAFAAMVALCIRSFAYEPFNIPSGSMFPTLLVGDYLFVEKYSYGYSEYSFPFGITSFHGRIFGKHPKRGDVAVFRHPKKPGIDYIKRIIGLPGDEIQVKEGILHINGEPVIRDFRNTETADIEKNEILYKKYIETLPNGVKHFIYEHSDSDFFDNTPTYNVPDGYYFAMGDNRDSSLDSRAQEDVGFIPEDNLIGRAWFLFFSIDDVSHKCPSSIDTPKAQTVLCKIIHWPTAIRFNRFFKVINKLDENE